MKNVLKKSLYIFIVLYISGCGAEKPDEQEFTVKDVMDDVITRLYKEVPPEKYKSIDDAFILDFLTPEEKAVLATKYQYFKVNVPVTVSLMRDVHQPVVPFWLEAAGFKKTGETVKSEVYEYEVWKKDFEPGLIELGINGFDMNRTVYFICVGPKNPDDKLEITDVYPSEFRIIKMGENPYTYNDWDDLYLKEYPSRFRGQYLFTTIRGRAREAHVVGAFRETIFPTSGKPDQILLTWSDDPATTVNIQWRTNTDVQDGMVKYWISGSTDTLSAEAARFVMQDRMLYNDRYIHRFTALLSGLKPGKTYQYKAGSHEKGIWSDVRNFKTEPKGTDKFSFIWFGDTHQDSKWGEVLQKADKRHEDVAFYSIAGDLVSTGLYRTDWDKLFGYSGDVFSYKPLMPVPGNHDRQDGLGAWMYYELFALPKNGPEKVHPESTYAFRYGNALFLMIDSTHPNDDQTEWIEDQLKNTDATWKFVMFHFPPYNFEEPYFDIQKVWVPLFDKYHVDMVMSGHIHYYMRSKPMKAGKVVRSYNEGTAYIVSIGTNGSHDDIGEEPYAVKRYKKGLLYQYINIDGNVMKYTVYNKDGNVKDEYMVRK